MGSDSIPKPTISVVVPTREPELGDDNVTLLTLRAQTFQSFEVIVRGDEGRGAPWARNRGAEAATGDYLFFADDDCEFVPDALELLLRALEKRPQASYAFGSYEMDGRAYCAVPFDPYRLRRMNLASTMSLIRRPDFPGWDESLVRLQDWSLWLTMLERGKVGVQCGRLIFRTARRNGITFGSGLSYLEAAAIIKKKHGLNGG